MPVVVIQSGAPRIRRRVLQRRLLVGHEGILTPIRALSLVFHDDEDDEQDEKASADDPQARRQNKERIRSHPIAMRAPVVIRLLVGHWGHGNPGSDTFDQLWTVIPDIVHAGRDGTCPHSDHNFPVLGNARHHGWSLASIRTFRVEKSNVALKVLADRMLPHRRISASCIRHGQRV